MENPTKSTKSSKSGGVKRPMNSFLMFCKKHRAIVHEKHPHLDNRSVTKILGDHWARMKDEEKTEYKNAAKDNIQEFRKIHPDYKWYKPDSKFGQQLAPASEAPRVVPVPPEKVSVSQNSEEVNSSKHIAAIEGLSMLLLAGKERLPAEPKMIPINGQLGSSAIAGNPLSCGRDLEQLTRMMTLEHMQSRSTDGVVQAGEGLNRPLVFISSGNTSSGFPLGCFTFPVPFSVNSEHLIDLSQSASTRMNFEGVNRQIGSEPGRNAAGFSETLPAMTAGSFPSFSTNFSGSDMNAALLKAVLSQSAAAESGIEHATNVDQIPALQLQNRCLQLQGGNLPYLFRSGVSMPGQLVNFSITTPTSAPTISTTPLYQPMNPDASKPSSTAQPDRNNVVATRMYAPSLRKIMFENIIKEVYSKEKETEDDRTKEHFPKTKKQQASLPSSNSSNSSIPSAADGGSGPSNILSSVRYFDTLEDQRGETSYSNKTSLKTKLELDRDSESAIGRKKLKTNDIIGISGAATKPADAKISQSSTSFNNSWKATTEGSSSSSKNQYQSPSSAFSSMLMNGSTENTPFLKIIEGLITNSITGSHFEEKSKIGYNPITFVETKTQSISSEKDGSNYGFNVVKDKSASGIEDPSSQGLASMSAENVKAKRHRKKKRDLAASADGVAISRSSTTVTSSTGTILSSSHDGSSGNLLKIESETKETIEMNLTSRTNDSRANGDVLGIGALCQAASESNMGIVYRKFDEEELHKRLFCNEKFEIPKKEEETAMGNADEGAAEEGRVEMRKRKTKDEINNNSSLRKSKRCNRGKIYNELISQGVLNRKRSSSVDAEAEDVPSSPGLNESFTSNEGSPSQTLPINSTRNLIRSVDHETQMTSLPACKIDGPEKKTSAKVKSHNPVGPANPAGPAPTDGPAGTAHHSGPAIPTGPAHSVGSTQSAESIPRGSMESAPPACITHLPAGLVLATAWEKFGQQLSINLVDLRTHLEKLGRVHPSPEGKPVGSRKRKASRFPIFHMVRFDAVQHATSPADNKTNISTSAASSQINTRGTKSSAVTPVPCNV